MEESRGNWPLSIDQKCFDYPQVIQAWIKLSPLTIKFRHVKEHQMKEILYHQLDWWGQRNEDVDGAAKAFLHQCTSGSPRDRRAHNQPMLHLENGLLLWTVRNLLVSTEMPCITTCMAPALLEYCAEKDNTPKDPTRILWEESLQAMKRVSKLTDELTQSYSAMDVDLQRLFLIGDNKIHTPAQSVRNLGKIEIT